MKPPWIAILVFVAASIACVARLPIDGAKCPCPTGYCCVAGTCLPSDGTCTAPASQDSGAVTDVHLGGTDVDAPDVGAPAHVSKPGESCDIVSSIVGSTSNCEVGSECIADDCGLICHKLCTSDDQCGGGTCDLPVASGSQDKACRNVPRSCDPIANSGCGGPVRACFVQNDRTICDCPSGAHPENSSCTSSNNCFPGLTCVPVLAPDDLRCRRVCALGRPTCLPGSTCRPILGNDTHGSCQ